MDSLYIKFNSDEIMQTIRLIYQMNSMFLCLARDSNPQQKSSLRVQTIMNFEGRTSHVSIWIWNGKLWFGSGNIYSIEDYRSIISERAKEGWRYVGCIPTKQRGTGHIQEMDLIFEKEL